MAELFAGVDDEDVDLVEPLDVGDLGERVFRAGDAEDEYVRTFGDLRPKGIGREFMACPVDGHAPAMTFGEVFEDAVQLVLPCDSSHPQSHDDVTRFCFHFDGHYSKLQLIRNMIGEKMMFFWLTLPC